MEEEGNFLSPFYFCFYQTQWRIRKLLLFDFLSVDQAKREERDMAITTPTFELLKNYWSMSQGYY